jgi:mRNA interferase ChpB
VPLTRLWGGTSRNSQRNFYARKNVTAIFTRFSTAVDKATKLPVICPVTSGGEFARRIGFAVPLAGIKTSGVIRCDQPRVLDLGARQAQKIDALPASTMEEVLAKLAPIFE